MDRNCEILLGHLIGLARATDGNEHLINPSATAAIRRCLMAVEENQGDWDALLALVEEEKRAMVPNCFLCANPCGRTDPFDLSALPEGEVGQLKWQLLEALCRYARRPDAREELLYHCLVAAGIDGYEPEDLLPLIQAVS